VIHAAVMEVTEEGTVAAAVTVVVRKDGHFIWGKMAYKLILGVR
jgi:serine protease inhibitor